MSYNTIFSNIIDKISYLTDHKKLIDCLLKEREFSSILSSKRFDVVTKHLLKILKEPLTEENSLWIEQNATANQSDRKQSSHLLYSSASLNNIRNVNEFLCEQNHLLKLGGNFVCFFQTNLNRKVMIYQRFPVIIRDIVYFFDKIWHRVFPKFPGIRNLYFAVTNGKQKVFPRSEVLGRLYCCGLKAIHETIIDNNLYVVAKKIKEPSNDLCQNCGPLISLKRIGKDGKFFYVYKLRTMHAYSEYLQGFIYDHNKLAIGGKFANDYRIPSWGHFMRKYWLDELPTLINLAKGDMKLIGVRPLSQQYYGLYSEELQQLRTKIKPGIFPPYYVDMPKTLEEIEISEKKYIESYLQHPFKTDWSYFGKILYSILIGRKRSA